MSDGTTSAEAEGLLFFGAVSASISHDIKNVMATVSETAGLIGDLIGVAGGDPQRVDLKEISELSETIVEEVQRGFRVVKLLNRLAHSSDEPIADVDVNELLALVVDVGHCLSYSCQVTVEPAAEDLPRIRTCPLLLEDLLYRALNAAFRAAGPEGEVKVSVRPVAAGVEVAFRRLAEGFRGYFESPGLDLFERTLQARIDLDQNSAELRIILPARVDQSCAG